MAKHHFNSYLRLMQLVGKDEGLQQQLYVLKYVLRILMRESYSNILVVSSVDVETSVIC